jgi:hypothetical protein
LIEFAQGTPIAVQVWLQSIAETRQRLVSLPIRSRKRPLVTQRAIAGVRSDHPIAKALAGDERMANIWNLIGDWPGSSGLIKMAIRYSNPPLLANLMEPPEARTAFGFAASYLSSAGEDFAVALEIFPDTAAALLGEPVGALVAWLRAFAAEASQTASESRTFYDFLLAPSRRGRGDPHQLLFRNAMGAILKRLLEHYGGRLSQASQDEIVAILASVVFPESEIDPETVRRQRERQRRRQRVPRDKA